MKTQNITFNGNWYLNPNLVKRIKRNPDYFAVVRSLYYAGFNGPMTTQLLRSNTITLSDSGDKIFAGFLNILQKHTHFPDELKQQIAEALAKNKIGK